MMTTWLRVTSQISKKRLGRRPCSLINVNHINRSRVLRLPARIIAELDEMAYCPPVAAGEEAEIEKVKAWGDRHPDSSFLIGILKSATLA
jgi:hypothetical protein